MNNAGIKITRFPYEEPYHLRLVIEASNGNLNGCLEYYCNASDLKGLGHKMSKFSGKKDEKIAYKLGSERPEDRFAFFFGLEIAALDSVGHCAIKLQMNNNRPMPYTEVCGFCISADLGDINRLGSLFSTFAKLEHQILKWSVGEGELLK